MPRKEVSSNNDIVYYIDAEKKVVVAKYYPNKFMFEQILNIFSDTFEAVQLTQMFEDALTRYDCFIGKAKCHPNDTFDVEQGKKLARNRAFWKYYAECIDIVEDYIYYLESKLNILSDILNNCQFRQAKIGSNIKRLTGECK